MATARLIDHGNADLANASYLHGPGNIQVESRQPIPPASSVRPRHTNVKAQVHTSDPEQYSKHTGRDQLLINPDSETSGFEGSFEIGSEAEIRDQRTQHGCLKQKPHVTLDVPTDLNDTQPQPAGKPWLTVTKPSKVEALLPEHIQASQRPSVIIVIIKWIVIIITFLAFLFCIVMSKISVVHMTTLLKNWTDIRKPRHDEKEQVGQESLVLLILLTIMIPYFLTFLRSIWCGAFRSDRPWPSRKALACGIFTAIAESAGISLFTLDVLPYSPSYIGILLMNGVFFIPIICQLAFSIRRHHRNIQSESRCATTALVVALLFALVGLTLVAIFEIGNSSFANDKLWEVPLSILLLSAAWCPILQKLQLDPPVETLRNLVKKTHVPKYSEEVRQLIEAAEIGAGNASTADTPTPSVSSTISGASSSTLDSLWSRASDIETNGQDRRSTDPDELPLAWAHPQYSARWKITIITSFIKLLLIPGFGILYGYVFQLASVPDLHTGFYHITTNHPAFNCFMISIFCSLGGYLLGWGACVMGIHKAAFTAPLVLGTPLAVTVMMIKPSCEFIFAHLKVDCTLDMTHNPYITIPAAFCLYISQVLSVGLFLFKTVTIVMPKESQIFWLPGYNSIFLEQHLLLNRKNKQTDVSNMDLVEKAKKTKVFICTTMYREAQHEMEQLLESYGRVNKAKQQSDRDFQAHIFLDNGVRGTRLTPFALQLISTAKSALGVVAECCTKMATPYGMRLTWCLPSVIRGKRGMCFTIHLKDNRKVKNKKRWSQIMYMSYILDYLIREDENATDEDSFILTTDADIRFNPDSVEALLDLMVRDQSVGAVCSRTHPLGSGPIYWYQIFDYAIGHWLQKVSNHVLGCVLCCPGCFSVYRVEALRDVVSTYATGVDRASEFLTKDMGEDRWLCTLMVQAGWRLEYCAAAENHTYCPEEFEEYFKQRRRWIPSSLANQVLLLQEWRTIYFFNKQISLLFILYQGILMASALIMPSVCILIIVGGLYYAWHIPQALSMVVLLAVTFAYGWICLTFSQNVQLKIAKALTVLFAMVMAVTTIGTILQIVENPNHSDVSVLTTVKPAPIPPINKSHHAILGPIADNLQLVLDSKKHMFEQKNVNGYEEQTLAVTTSLQLSSLGTSGDEMHHRSQQHRSDLLFESHVEKESQTEVPPHESTTEPPLSPKSLSVSTMYLIGTVAIFGLTGLMHLEEAFCLIHGLWYLLCLPSGNLLLIVYSLCNITDRSWGTREEKKNTGFGNVMDWQTTVRNALQKIFFCCVKDAPKEVNGDQMISESTTPRAPTSGNSSQKGRGNESQETSDDAFDRDSATDMDGTAKRSTEGTRRYRSKKLDRKVSFKFHYDDNESDAKSVRDWLPSNIRNDYAGLFVKHGYEDTSFIAGMTEADVIAVGVKSKAHISAIMTEVKRLPDPEIEPCVPDNADEWLDMIGMHMYVTNFRRANIVTRTHLEFLRAMSKQDIIEELGICKPGHLCRLKLAIENLRYPTPAEREIGLVKSEIDALECYDLAALGQREHDFWETLRQERLLPESVAFAHDLDLKEKLTELRNSVMLLFAVSNALWLILIMTLVTHSQLNVFNTNALGLSFLVVFGLVLCIQFLCMVAHRLSTWMHQIARAPIKRGDPYNATWSWNDSILEANPRPDSRVISFDDSVDVSASLQKRMVNDEMKQRYRRDVRDLQNRHRSRALSAVQEEDDTPLLSATNQPI